MNDFDCLSNIISHGDIIIFAGAGISKKPPSSAPLWNDIRNEIVLCLRKRLDSFDLAWKTPILKHIEDALKDLATSNIAPEIVMEGVRKTLKDNLLKTILNLLVTGQPNIIHRLIAKLCKNGIVKHVITTNLDLYLEQALSECEQKFIVEFDLSNYSYQQGCASLTKLHGSADNFEKVTLTLKDAILGMAKSKRKSLVACLKDKNILFTGYSGRDIDIFPELIKIIENNSSNKYYVNCLHNDSSPINKLCLQYPDKVFPIYSDAEKVFLNIAKQSGIELYDEIHANQNNLSENIIYEATQNISPFDILYFFCEYFYSINRTR